MDKFFKGNHTCDICGNDFRLNILRFQDEDRKVLIRCPYCSSSNEITVKKLRK